MPNTYFQFKQFRIEQGNCGMKVTTEACLFGALAAQLLPENCERILDIGTGTGLLALMLAQSSIAKIHPLEIDDHAFQQAKENFQHSPWAERLFIEHCDLRDYHPDVPFDFIICNPPFFEKNQLGKKETKNKAIHNFSLGFEALAQGIKTLLSPEQGLSIVLYPEYEMSVFKKSMVALGLEEHVSIDIYNQTDKPVFRQIKVFSKKKSASPENQRLIIKKENGEYTQEFISLMEAYYLHL
jgi:tRNA1Val (adenine37-N6)-methyltransferase